MFTTNIRVTIDVLKFSWFTYWFSGWGPYAYFRALEESSTSGARVDRSVNGVGLQSVEIQDMNRQNGNNGFRQVSLSNSIQDDVEYGKM